MFRFLIALLLVLSESDLRAEGSDEVQILEGRAQGTTYTIEYSGALRPQLGKDLEALLKAYDHRFSNYRADSEISRLNQNASSDWIPIHPELYALLKAALALSEKTDGAFDVTLGSLLELWGFGPYKKPLKSVPSERQIQAALAKSGWKNIELRESPRSIRRKVTGLKIDLSGIAQGDAVDKIYDELSKQGLRDFSIELGGEVRARGKKPDGKPWAVALEWPLENSGSMAKVIRLDDASISTSGSYRKYQVLNKTKFTHIFDPRLGRPVETEILSASVLAPLCRDADALAKAIMILPKSKREILIKDLKLSVLTMTANATGGFDIQTQGNFERYYLAY